MWMSHDVWDAVKAADHRALAVKEALRIYIQRAEMACPAAVALVFGDDTAVVLCALGHEAALVLRQCPVA